MKGFPEKMKYPKVCDYVPEPQPVGSGRIIACHYYPGWKKGKSGIHNGFADLRNFRTAHLSSAIKTRQIRKWPTGKSNGQ